MQTVWRSWGSPEKRIGSAGPSGVPPRCADLKHDDSSARCRARPARDAITRIAQQGPDQTVRWKRWVHHQTHRARLARAAEPSSAGCGRGTCHLRAVGYGSCAVNRARQRCVSPHSSSVARTDQQAATRGRGGFCEDSSTRAILGRSSIPGSLCQPHHDSWRDSGHDLRANDRRRGGDGSVPDRAVDRPGRAAAAHGLHRTRAAGRQRPTPRMLGRRCGL
jgi:hypothetical protein